MKPQLKPSYKMIKRTYRFTDGTVDKKVKLLKDTWKLKTEGAVIEKLIMDKKV